MLEKLKILGANTNAQTIDGKTLDYFIPIHMKKNALSELISMLKNTKIEPDNMTNSIYKIVPNDNNLVTIFDYTRQLYAIYLGKNINKTIQQDTVLTACIYITYKLYNLPINLSNLFKCAHLKNICSVNELKININSVLNETIRPICNNNSFVPGSTIITGEMRRILLDWIIELADDFFDSDQHIIFIKQLLS